MSKKLAKTENKEMDEDSEEQDMPNFTPEIAALKEGANDQEMDLEDDVDAQGDNNMDDGH